MKIILRVAIVCSIILAEGCVSGKSAYKHGDYYDAVLSAVQRLRQNPDNKKSKEVLSLSYQAAVQYLETDAQNQISSGANFKWKSAVQNYERINNLYEQIRTSPGALKIIPNPVSKYKELTEVKVKAAEESYEAGIQAMLKNTRTDSKQAYFLFSDANTFSPGYREAIEMITQSKFNATLKVIVQPSIQNLYDWNFEPQVFGYRGNQFVQFYTPAQAQEQSLAKIDQFLTVTVNGFQESRPVVTKRVQELKDSVKTGEKTVNGKKVPVKKLVTAQMTVYEKKVTSRGSIRLVVVDAASKAEVRNSEIASDLSWVDSWATYSGDAEALSDANKALCAKKEPYMTRDYLVRQTETDLARKLGNSLSSFYSAY
jgi:hypothetical protein